MMQQMLAICSLVPLPFLKPAWTSGSSWFTYCWSLAWRILSARRSISHGWPQELLRSMSGCASSSWVDPANPSGPLPVGLRHQGLGDLPHISIPRCSRRQPCCAAAWCVQALNGGGFLDDKQWLSPMSQYYRVARQWNCFQDHDYFCPLSPRKAFNWGDILVFWWFKIGQ